MIFKDAREYIREAAQSVLAQTLSSLELIMVDDGGTDGSVEVAREVRQADPDRVRIISHPGRANRGMGASRAAGVEAARGTVVAFLDADDYWAPEHLQHEFDLLSSHPQAGMVCGRAWLWRSWAGAGEADELSDLAFAPGVVVEPPDLLAAVLRHGGLATNTCCLLVYTDLLRERLPSLLLPGMYEDQVIISALQLTVAAVMSGATTAYYRQHGGSVSAHAVRERTSSRSTIEVARRLYLGWLSSRPELTEDRYEPIRSLVEAALGELPQSGAIAQVRDRLSTLARDSVAPAYRAKLRAVRRPAGVGRVRLGSLDRATPISRRTEVERGTSVPDFYEERFFRLWASDIRGSVLEVGGKRYAQRLGDARTDSVSTVPDLATLVAAEPVGAVDCLLVAGPVESDLGPDVLGRLRDLVRPGGVLLLSLPGLDAVRADAPTGVHPRIFSLRTVEPDLIDVFGAGLVTIRQYGNVLAASASLFGMAARELSTGQLMHQDFDYPVRTLVRGVRSVG